MKRRLFEAEVIDCLKLSSGVFGIKFRAGHKLNALPGQFVSLQSLCFDKMWGRPFAVFQQEANDFYVFFEVRGENTKKYSQLKVGDRINIIGPLGNPLAIHFEYCQNIFVAGGMGISGLMFAIKEQGKKSKCLARLYYGARDQNFLDNFNLTELGPNVTVKTITDDKGMVTDLLCAGLEYFGSFGKFNIIACGPEAMLRKTAEIAAKWKIPCQVVIETLIACGVGSCKGCVVPKVGGGYFHLCQDGPALPGDMVDWEKLSRPSVIVLPERRKPVEEIKMETVLVGRDGRRLVLPSPIIVESGCLDEGAVIDGPVDLTHVGAIKSKGLTLEPREGNPPPRICETPSGMLNSIGLENVGLKKFINEQWSRLKSLGVEVIVNFSGYTIEEFLAIADALYRAGVRVFELNLSCPNTKKGNQMFSSSPEDTFEITSKVRRVAPDVFLLVKLSPMVTNLTEVAQAAEAAEADALSLLNTYLGMKIDLATRRPALGNVYGGMSGPEVMSMALRLVHLVCQQVSIPVIASTGITCGADAAEYIIAGAQAVAIGSGLFPNPNVVPETFHELREVVAAYGMSDIKELVGSLILEK